MTPDPPTVRVGVCVIILKSKQEPADNPQFLIGKRLDSLGKHTWAAVGGHLEFGETPEECAARETMEETGLRITNLRLWTVTNDIWPANQKHYVTLMMVCEREDENAEARNMEPHKCAGWEWASWSDLLRWIKETKEGKVPEKPLYHPWITFFGQHPDLIPTCA